MRIIGNLLWWLFGGLEAAIGYLPEVWLLHVPSSAFPLRYRHSRLVGLSLAPFGKDVELGF